MTATYLAAPAGQNPDRCMTCAASLSPARTRSRLVARVDVELGEHVVQVVLDGTRADEQPRADLGVREAVAGEPRDLGLLGGELAAGLDAAFAGGLAGGAQLARGALGDASIPIAVSISWAVRRCSRASRNRFWRR